MGAVEDYNRDYRIEIDTAPGDACPRCWKHHEMYANHDHLCDRCCQVLRDHSEFGPKIKRSFEAQREWCRLWSESEKAAKQMGAHSTMDITRADALGEIMRNLLKATDDQIASVLYGLVGDKMLYNFHIVDSYSDAWPSYKPGDLG